MRLDDIDGNKSPHNSTRLKKAFDGIRILYYQDCCAIRLPLQRRKRLPKSMRLTFWMLLLVLVFIYSMLDALRIPVTLLALRNTIRDYSSGVDKTGPGSVHQGDNKAEEGKSGF
jgi:hypothetical protein